MNHPLRRLSGLCLLFLILGHSCMAKDGATTTLFDSPSDFVPTKNVDNMNGFYPLSPTPGANSETMAAKFPRNYKDYPRGVEMFEVYSPPMTTLYSQVWWKPLEPVDLPADIIKRYSNQGMAIVGWEIDQVRFVQDNTTNATVEHSVPISASYNHHYVAFMVGGEASFREVNLDGPNDPLYERLLKQSGGHGIPLDQTHYLIEGPAKSSSRGLPTHQQFNSANGGEFRKSFHGFAPGNVLVVDSPKAIQISPMQIDTWNRDKMDISDPENKPPKFVPGPLPRASLSKPNSLHSGLLECPLTTRVTKVIESTNYTLVEWGTKISPNSTCDEVCDDPLETIQECTQATYELFQRAPNWRYRQLGRGSQDPVQGDCYWWDGPGNPAYCICATNPTPFGAAKGYHKYNQMSQKEDIGSGNGARFDNKCRENPSLIEERNPTCDIRHYRGGQSACHHMWSLLDAEQEIPWVDQPLVFRHKYRFWVQPYDKNYHTSLKLGESVGSALLLGSPWEYDVPKCSKDIAECEQLDEWTWVHTIRGHKIGRHTFATLNNHCHAPTCLSVAVYACPEKRHQDWTLETCNEENAKLICETKPIYGGTNHPDVSDSRFDEPGYIAIPQCVWGSSELYGLEEPPNLDGVPLLIVKKSNATEGHYGEMSGSQPWVVVTPADDKEESSDNAADG